MDFSWDGLTYQKDRAGCHTFYRLTKQFWYVLGCSVSKRTQWELFVVQCTFYGIEQKDNVLFWNWYVLEVKKILSHTHFSNFQHAPLSFLCGRPPPPLGDLLSVKTSELQREVQGK